jgi:hypothetical protein
MTAFDPGAVPPTDDDPLADPAEAELQERLDEAKALLGPFPPVADPGRFLAPAAVEAAALLREHDVASFYQLHEALRPHKVLRIWLRAVAAVSKGMAEGEHRVAEKTRLIAIAIELLELWHDGSEAWCWAKEHGPGCCWRMPGSEVKRYLLRGYGERHQMTLDGGDKVPLAPGRQAVGEALDQLEAAAHGGHRRPEPGLRVAGDGARLVLDLCRDDHSVVEVTPGGWQVVKPSPLALRRAEGMKPLPLPVQGAGDALGKLRELLGFAGAELDAFWSLLVGFMFACLRPVSPYFVLVLGGEQGTGKSTTVRLLRMQVDPHKIDLQPKPRSEDDLFVNADGQWLLGYDNLSTLDQHWSDAFSRIATGSGYSKRKLYSDRDTAQFQVARPQIVTSIIDVAAAPDLLDRALLAQMPELGELRDEAEVLAGAAALAPRVLGQLLDAAAVALRDQGKVELSLTPRMVGPAKWIEAGAGVLGLEPEQFLSAYLDSQARAGELALEASLLGAPLRDMLDQRKAFAAIATAEGRYYAGPVGFEGEAQDLLKQLNDFMQGKPHPGRGWPKTPRAMSGALRRIAPALRKLGYRVDFAKVGHARTRVITLETPQTKDARSADNANHRPHRPHRPQNGGGKARADGADGADGRMHTQTNGGHSKEEARGRPTCDQPGCEHTACSTGPGGAWCADHMEPHQREAGGFVTCPTCGGSFRGSAPGGCPTCGARQPAA